MNEQEDQGLAVQGKAVPPANMAGTLALAQMSDQEFEQRLAALKKGQERVARVQRELMKEDVDYGKIPGTGDKPTLLKPGAEKLCNLYGLIPEFKYERFMGDGESAPTLQFLATCYLHAGAEGPVVGMGMGEANSWERKHRYRTAEKACPKCGALKTISKSKAERGGGWFCWSKKGGCGATFAEDDPTITSQQGGQVDNPDPYDLNNTLIKMAAKRAYVDATLRTTATSGLFTQDMEDTEEPHGQTPTQTAPPPPSQRTATPPPSPKPPTDASADAATAFFATAKGYGYTTPGMTLGALAVRSLDEWQKKNPGKTLADALDELAELKGVKGA